MQIQTGKGMISLITLMGIWSISALNALPGLAISPILGKLSTIFPHATELDLQMLSSLPSFLTIPCIILSGKLTEKVNNIALLQIGLWIFLFSGLLYLFSTEIWQLIAVSTLLGIGSGLVIPLSTGLISRYFDGKYRTKQFGLSSSITNVTLVLATMLTGYLVEINWRLPFTVYLFAFIPILFSYSLDKNLPPHPQETLVSKSSKQGYEEKSNNQGIQLNHLIQIMCFYGLATYLVVIINFNLSFLMEEYHFTSSRSGLMISLFFLAIMAPGFILNPIVSLLGRKTKFYSMLSITLGLALITFSPNEWIIGLGCVLAGLGYGIIQPIAYDKATRIATPEKATLSLAFVMVMNYLAILLCPFILHLFEEFFHIKTQQFAFTVNLLIALITAVWVYTKQDSFLCDDNSISH
ncbi:MAG: MFS transporter [Parabacteroides sp.]|nr:MFS transporter [Parabacteroides sp.]